MKSTSLIEWTENLDCNPHYFSTTLYVSDATLFTVYNILDMKSQSITLSESFIIFWIKTKKTIRRFFYIMFQLLAVCFLCRTIVILGSTSYLEVARSCFQFNGTTSEDSSGFNVPPEILVDQFNKVILDWTPKASCTSAVVMFFDHMGLHRGIHYDGWPHEYRETRFYREYGLASLNMFEDEEWIRIKVVRNPFDRLVSSYIHAMKFDVVLNMDRVVLDNMTFSDFVTYIESKNVDELYDLGSRHVGFQHRRYEYCFYLRNTAVYQVVKVEDAESALTALNEVLTGHPLHLKYKSDHYVSRTEHYKNFVGNIPWYMLRDNIPLFYKQFYNEDLRKRVEQLFHLDLQIYNYSFLQTF